MLCQLSGGLNHPPTAPHLCPIRPQEWYCRHRPWVMGIYRVGFFGFPLLRQPRGECLHAGQLVLPPSAMWVLASACGLACMVSACLRCNCMAAMLVAATCTCRCALHSTASSFAFRHPESAGRRGAARVARHAERRAAHHLGCVAACSIWYFLLSAQRTVALAAWPTSPPLN